MEKINIVQSSVEPAKENIWMKDGDLQYFSSSGWKSMVESPTIDDSDVVTFDASIFKEIGATYTMTEEECEKVKKASVIRIKEEDGRYTPYFYSADRLEYARIPYTTNAVQYTYFEVISFTEATRTLTLKVFLRDSAYPEATVSKRGTVKAAVNVNNVSDSSALVTAFNALLANLRTAGILET